MESWPLAIHPSQTTTKSRNEVRMIRWARRDCTSFVWAQDKGQKREQRGLDHDICLKSLQAWIQAGAGGAGGISIWEAGSW